MKARYCCILDTIQPPDICIIIQNEESHHSFLGCAFTSQWSSFWSSRIPV
jgi:hypothetical protein